MRCIIIDVDGTIADCSHRRKYLEEKPKNWEMFFEESKKDDLILPVRTIVNMSRIDFKIIFVTGRPEKYRQLTYEWFQNNFVHYDYLYMRKDEDFRPDHEIKKEILYNEILPNFDKPFFVIDDRQSVVDMWRKEGLLCFQMEPQVY